MAQPSSNPQPGSSRRLRKGIMREISNHVNLWESRYEEHATKQLHNPFSNWSGVRPKTPLTSPSGEYSKPPSFYSQRSPSPFEEEPSYFNPQRFNPSGGQPTSPYYPATFSPQKQPPSPLYPTNFSPTKQPASPFYPTILSPTKQPSSPFYPTTLSPTKQPSSPFYPQSYNPSGEQSPGFLSPKSPNPPQRQDPEICSPPNIRESGGQVNFLNRVKKWRKPGTEVEELVPLTKIPEPAKPAPLIKVKVPIPTPEDPLSRPTFSPQQSSWSDRPQQRSFSSQVAEKPEYLKWRVSPEKECFSFNLEKPVKLKDIPEVIPGWTPMGKTFAKSVGGKQTISNDIYTESRQDTSLDVRYPDPVINPPTEYIPFYANQLEESEPSDMNYLRRDMSSQINLWQQRATEHQQKQLLNPFSEWDGASHHAKLSKTDPNYGKPIEGSMTEKRGKKADEHISNEIIELCDVIYDLGLLQPNNTIVIKFGVLFQAYTRISNKLVGMLMRARKQNLVNFEGEMLFQGRDDDVDIILLKRVEQRTTESAAAAAVESESGDEARSSGWMPKEFNLSASGEEDSTTGASSEEMLSRSESANSTNMVSKKGSSICSSSMSNQESSMSMNEESMGSSKMMASSASSNQMMSKEDGEFSTKMFAGSSNTSKMMAKEESSSSTKMFSESSSSMKMLKEEGSLSTQMLGEAVGDGNKMLAGVSISPSVTKEELLGSMKAGDIFNSMKMVPGEGSAFPQQLMQSELGTLSNMGSSSEMLSKQASSSSSSSMMSSSKQTSMASEQMTSAMENMSMSSEECKQMKMSSSQMSSASEQMSMASEQMSMSSEQMSSSNSQMKQISDFSQVSSSDMMSGFLDDPFSKMVSNEGSSSCSSIQKSSQQSSSSKLLSQSVSSFESSSNTALMDETHSLMSSGLQDFKQLT